VGVNNKKGFKTITPNLARIIMRVLLISSSYNGLCQRVHVKLEFLRHDVSVTLALSDDHIREAVKFFHPDLIICPFLKEKVPSDIYKNYLCLIVHPGIRGDRGPSSLDWAIKNQETEWGVTILQADDEMDAGDIWSSPVFKMRAASKAAIYRREVGHAALQGILDTLARIERGDLTPEPLNYADPKVFGKLRPLMKQTERRIDWAHDPVKTIINKIHAADSCPGVLDTLYGEEFYLFGAHLEDTLKGGKPGEIIAQRHGAICRATIDGAVWISHLKKKSSEKLPFYKHIFSKSPILDFKLPAAMLLGKHLETVPESAIDLLHTGSENTFKEIWYREENQVGYLHFDFHNGAMDTQQCRRLREAYLLAAARPTKVLVLMGGGDFWSNGIHLNIIEASCDPANESWRNINAIDDFVLAVINTLDKLTVSAVWGGAGAGGAMALLAADKVWASRNAVVNPHYKTMGLYGSEYWTYLLPKRVGPAIALELTEIPLPLGMDKAKTIGYIDELLFAEYDEFLLQLKEKAESLATDSTYERMLEEKIRLRALDEQIKPISAYRAAELKHMKRNFAGKFYGGEVNYHEARYNFVHKIRPKETAAYLAKHRRLDRARFQELRQPLNY
jgi:putative two-component system protein, hydrogenase maturation factor HypX/HoxX